LIRPWCDDADTTGIGIVGDIVDGEVGRVEEEDAARDEVSADVGFLCLCCVEEVVEMIDRLDVEGARRGEVGLRVERRVLGEVE
jgi:hypothetical protein